MKRRLAPALAVGLVIVVAAATYFLSGRHYGGVAAQEKASSPSIEAGPVAQVKTTVVRNGAIQETIRVYGYVIPAPGAATTIAVPFESRVLRIMVSEGQEVSGRSPYGDQDRARMTRLKFSQAAESIRYDEAGPGEHGPKIQAQACYERPSAGGQAGVRPGTPQFRKHETPGHGRRAASCGPRQPAWSARSLSIRGR